MLNIFKNLFDDNAREIKRLQPLVDEINSLEVEMEKLSDLELQGKTQEFRQLLENGQTLNDLLPQAFAVCREASKRVLNMRHFDVQLIGGIVLHQGKIAEMSTGEGKTLVATLPSYLNALAGKGVHIVTVNEYLATRDYQWMAKLYNFLGLSVGLTAGGLSPEDRRQAYQADVTYGTNKEFSFDYLRDNLAQQPENLVQRGLSFAILDEIDSILIDESRSPVAISGKSDHVDTSADLCYKMANIISKLERDVDYEVDDKLRTAVFTEAGVDKVEEWLDIENLYDESNLNFNHRLSQALKALVLLHRGKDYVVTEGQVVIVDEFTGRLMHGRRYNDGLHQAIEAKEGLEVRPEAQNIVASTTYQNYFRMYEKLAGMTGTAATEEQEFRNTYGIGVVIVPTNKPMVRTDLSDVVYKTEIAKLRAVVDEVVQRHQTGQPVLVGTTSISKSEFLSALLKRQGIPNRVLNAQYHDKEAEIIAQAGRYKAVTIATNMAGRGIDILLGGNPEVLARTQLNKNSLTAKNNPNEYQQLLEKFKKQCEEECRRVVELGGLHIIGTERHESRRIDNQLRGRAGRQGDPGSSRFYVSLEDHLMRLFGSEDVVHLMERLGMEEDIPIESAIVTKSIETAQKRMETRNFKTRQYILDYDDVLNHQRKVIYDQRRQVLMSRNVTENIQETITKVIEYSVDTYCPEGVPEHEWDLVGLLEYAEKIYLPNHTLKVEDLEEMGRQGLIDELSEKSFDAYRQREEKIGPDTMREVERLVLLQMVDRKWIHHLNAINELREGVGLRAYGSKDPLMEYKYESIDMFNIMITEIREEVVRLIFRVKPQNIQH